MENIKVQLESNIMNVYIWEDVKFSFKPKEIINNTNSRNIQINYLSNLNKIYESSKNDFKNYFAIQINLFKLDKSKTNMSIFETIKNDIDSTFLLLYPNLQYYTIEPFFGCEPILENAKIVKNSFSIQTSFLEKYAKLKLENKKILVSNINKNCRYNYILLDENNLKEGYKIILEYFKEYNYINSEIYNYYDGGVDNVDISDLNNSIQQISIYKLKRNMQIKNKFK